MDIAVPLPLRVIMEMLGVPRADEPLMLKLTQQMFSAADPELGSNNAFEAMGEMVAYFLDLVAARQADPTEDLTSAIANATIDDEPMESIAMMGLFAVLASAGHDTTSFAMSGGVLELARRPEEFRRLRDDPTLADNAAHEVVRITSPVRHFTRVTQSDTEVAGHRFEKGDRVLLSYPSANRDESVFPDPDRLDVGRSNAVPPDRLGARPALLPRCPPRTDGDHRAARGPRPRGRVDRPRRTCRMDGRPLRQRGQAPTGPLSAGLIGRRPAEVQQ